MDNFLQFLTADFFQLSGFIVGLIGIFISLYIFRQSQQTKKLTYSIVLQSPIMTLTGALREKLELSYMGKKVQDVRLVILKLQNSGNTPIIPSDFAGSLQISFGENAKILHSDVTETNPKSIHVQLQANESFITISPILLNSRDSITITFLVEQYSGNVYINAQIRGVKEINEGAI